MDVCQKLKGNSQSEVSQQVKNIRLKYGIEEYKQKLRQEKMTTTASKLWNMSAHMPNTLKTIYREDKVREQENCENVLNLVKDFEDR